MGREGRAKGLTEVTVGQDEKGLVKGKEEKFGRSCPESWLSLGNQSSAE